MAYPNIFSPGRIGSLTTKNRIKYAATESNFNTRDGFVTDREIAYMEAQARGGAAIVTTQGAYPDSAGVGKGFRGTMSVSHDRFIPGLAKLAHAIKGNGALAALQILHCGREGGRRPRLLPHAFRRAPEALLFQASPGDDLRRRSSRPSRTTRPQPGAPSTRVST